MLFSEVGKFISGRVYFTASEGFPGELMNACVKNNVKLLDVTVYSDKITAAVDYKDFDALLNLSRSVGMAVEVHRRYGIKHIFHKYRFRWGIPAGAALFFAILMFLSSMLWSVEVRGLTVMKEEAFLSFLDEIGIRKGIFLRNISCNEIEAEAQRIHSGISKVTVNLVGTKMFIEVHERVVPLEITGENSYCNVVAAMDGEVLSADILAGVGKVKAGDAVLRGDELASGVLPLPDGSVRYVKADAVIRARTHNYISCSVAVRLNVKEVVRTKDRYGVEFFSLKLTPAQKETAGASFSSAAKFLRTFHTVFPIGTVRTRETLFQDKTLLLTADMAKLICYTDVALYGAFLPETKEPAERQIRFHSTGGIGIDADFICEENIAVQEFFEPNMTAD